MKRYTAKTRRAIDAVRAGTLPADAANDNNLRLNYLYQELKALGIAIPTRPRATRPAPPIRLATGDRVRLSDNLCGTVCARVMPRDQFAYVLPDDGSRVVVVDAVLSAPSDLGKQGS